jgi:hypothetical protein
MLSGLLIIALPTTVLAVNFASVYVCSGRSFLRSV